MAKKEFDEVVSKLNKHYGKEVLKPASDPEFQIRRIPTGVLTVDRLLGGGIATGRWTEFYGRYSTLKTYISLRTIASAQKTGLKALYCDAERSFDRVWAGRVGVDIDALQVYTPDTGEELIDVVETVLRSRQYGIVVVDSVAALLPQSEREQSATKESMGLQGRLNSKMMRRLTAALSTDTAVILINQLREKIGIMWGNPETTTGGRAIPFYAGQRLEFRITEKLKKKVDGKDKVVGAVVSIRVEKDKTGPNVERTGSVHFLHARGIDNAEDILANGEYSGIITRTGNSYEYAGAKAHGRDNFKSKLRKDPELRRELKKAILNA